MQVKLDSIELHQVQVEARLVGSMWARP